MSRSGGREVVSKLLVGRIPIGIVFVLMSIAFGIVARGFFTSGEWSNIIVSTALFLLIALGETYVIITGGIDISVSSNLALTGVISGALLTSMYSGHGSDWGVTLVVLIIALSIGAFGGLINGILVSVLGINPLIVTIGTWGAFLGLAELVSTEHPVGALPASSFTLGDGTFGVSYVVWIAIAATIVFSFLLWRTRFGRYVTAIGANRESANRAGIGVRRNLTVVYVLTGFMAGLAGFLSTCHFQTASSETGSSYLLIAIAAVVIGGTPLVGGEGSIWGTAIGALIISVLENGFVMAGINAFWQLVAVGAATVAAVYFGQIQAKMRLALISASQGENPGVVEEESLASLPDVQQKGVHERASVVADGKAKQVSGMG